MRKVKIKKLLHSLFIILLFSIILFTIGLVIGIIITNNSTKKLYDILTYEGILLIVIGIFMSMKGSPSGSNLSGIGSKNAQGISFMNSEVTRMEREINPYHKNYFQNHINHFNFYNLVLLLSGLLMIAASIMMIYS